VTTPSLATVSGWRPGSLVAAADRLVGAAASVSDDAAACRRHLGDAVDDAGGAWATTARSRADQEARRGQALADALTGAATALRSGAEALDRARGVLLAAVDHAQAAGFGVSAEGRVVAPAQPPPPADLAPLDQLGWEVAPEQREAARLVEDRRAAHEAEIAGALAGAAAADEALADSVAGLEIPETLPSMLAAHQARTQLLGGDPVAALGTAGGAVVVARAANDTRSFVNGGRRLHRYADLARQGAAGPVLEDARRGVAHGTSRNPVLKVLGRVSMPLTIVSGAEDTLTGGGYDGARGWATRGFGAAGAVGAGVVMAGAVLAPAAVVAGGAAVLAYGAWTTGNYVVDHWDQVEDAWEAADEWVEEQRDEAVEEVGQAVDWAHERLDAAGSGTLDALGELF